MATVRERVIETANTLPAAPRIFAEVDRLLRDPNRELDAVAAIIKRDSALVALVIRESNSAVYGGEQPTASVEEAVARIGFEEVFRVLGRAATSRLSERPLAAYHITTEELRQHMVWTALACEHLAAAAGMDSRGAYTTGILRPIGLVVLDRLAEQHAGEIPAYQRSEHTDYLVWEGRSFGVASSEIGGIVLSEWGFPTEVIEAVRRHYLVAAEDLNDRYACLLNLACSVVAEEGYGLPGETSHWDAGRRTLGVLGLTEAQRAAAAAQARSDFAIFERRFGRHAGARTERAPRVNVSAHEGDKAFPAGSGNFASSPRVVQANDEPPVQISSAAPSAPPARPTPPGVAPAVSPPPDFTTFMRNYQDMVYSTAARITANDAQAEDIAQDVFVKAYENFDMLRHSPTAGGWLKTVATNLSLNHVSRYRNRWRFFSEFRRNTDAGDTDEAPVEFAAPDTFFTGLDAADRREMVEQALAQLPEHQRVPLVLYHFEDMPYDEIAKKLRISLAKVKTDILRARAALAKILTRGGAAHETASL